MSFLTTIDRLSYRKVIALSIFLTLLFAIPLSVLLVQQQTQLASRAYEVPQPLPPQPLPSPGPIPSQPPQIGRVFPWLGKTGDIIWIQGQNFGQNPSQKTLTIGNTTLSDDQIDSWENNLIQAYIPPDTQTGETVTIHVGSHPKTESLPLVIYDASTTIKLTQTGSSIFAQSGREIAKIRVWTGNESLPIKETQTDIIPSPQGLTFLFDTAGRPLLTLLLYDSSGRLLPYYVDPKNFGF